MPTIFKFDVTPLFKTQFEEISCEDKPRILAAINAIKSDPSNCSHGLQGKLAGWYEKWVGHKDYRIYYAICKICRKSTVITKYKCEDCNKVDETNVRFLKIFTKKDSDEYLSCIR